MTYKIFIQTENSGVLVFKGVKNYSEIGSYTKFYDERDKKFLLFPTAKVIQIEEEK